MITDKAKEIARRAGIYQRHVVDCEDCVYDAEREHVKQCMTGEIMMVRYFAAMKAGAR